MDQQTIVYILGVIVAAIGAVFLWFRTSYWPHQQELEKQRLLADQDIQKRKEEAAEKQRQHEWDMAKREVDEKERQREHERKLIEARAQAEASGEGNLWKQVVDMQSKLMQRDEAWQMFLIDLATTRFDNAEVDKRGDAEKISKSYESIAHQIREVRGSLSVLVQDAVSREDERQSLKKIPETLLEILLQQQNFLTEMKKIHDIRLQTPV